MIPKFAGLLIPRLRLRGEGPSNVAAEVEAIAFLACLVCLAKVGKKGVWDVFFFFPLASY